MIYIRICCLGPNESRYPWIMSINKCCSSLKNFVRNGRKLTTHLLVILKTPSESIYQTYNKLKHQNTIQSLSVRPSSKYFPHPPTTIHFLQHYPGLRPWLVSANDNHYEYDQVTFITQRQDSHRLQIMAAREAPSVIENQNLNLVNQTNFTTGHLSLFIDWLG